MKLTFLLTVVLQVSTWATGFSQENRVSLQMKDVSLETIILELREQTGIRFFYSIDKIKAIDHLSIDVKERDQGFGGQSRSREDFHPVERMGCR